MTYSFLIMEMNELLKVFPAWLLNVGVIYVAVLLTVAVVRGQEVHFFPPKIGARPSGAEKAEPPASGQVNFNLSNIDTSLQQIVRRLENDAVMLRGLIAETTRDAVRAGVEGNSSGAFDYRERIIEYKSALHRIDDEVMTSLTALRAELQEMKERINHA